MFVAPSLMVWLLRAARGEVEKRRTAAKLGPADAGSAAAMPMFDEHFVFEVAPGEMNQLAVVVMVSARPNTACTHCTHPIAR